MPQARDVLLGHDAVQRPVVFVAMPTGQVLANLVPLFSLIEPDDRILWLATEEAIGRGWLERSQTVLATRHPELEQRTLGNLSETLDGWGEDLEAFAREVLERMPVLLINGGTKLLNYSVAEAFRRVGRDRYPVAYASTFHPPGLVLQPDGHGGRAERMTYDSQRCLRLPEVLAASGHGIATNNKGRRLWRAGEKIALPPEDGYGVDPEGTFSHHADVYRWMNRPRAVMAPPPSFAKADLEPGDIERLRNGVTVYSRSRSKANSLGNLYDLFRRVALDAANRKSRAAEQAETAPPRDRGAKLDERFESAVAYRVLSLLAGRPDLAAVVSEVWSNVTVVSETRKDGIEAEFDVLILNRHGSALALECKSGLGLYDPASENFGKDMHARQYRLSRAASKIARLVVCLPLYRQVERVDWQDSIVRHWRTSIEGRHDTVFFTLQDDEGGTIEISSDEPLEVPSFDEALAALISRA